MRHLLLLAALAPATVFAQSVEQTNLRYDEDWSLLRDVPREGWRQPKYVPLDDTGDAYLSLGAEARARFEGFGNNLWGDPPAPDDGYLWLRVMPHADLHAGPARVFVQGIAGYARGVGAGKGPADESGVDLLQGFADVRVALGGALGVIHGNVGLAHELGGVDGAVIGNRVADRGADMELESGDDEGPVE